MSKKLPPGFSKSGKIQGVPIKTWKTVGETWTGRYIGLEDSRKFAGSKLALGVTGDGATVKLTAPTQLAELLSAVPSGSVVHIEYTGEEDTGEDSPMKTFEVYLADKQD